MTSTPGNLSDKVQKLTLEQLYWYILCKKAQKINILQPDVYNRSIEISVTPIF